AERLQRRGVIVGLDFDRDLVRSAERQDAGVVDKSGKNPGSWESGVGSWRLGVAVFQNFLGCRDQEGFDQAIDLDILFKQTVCRIELWVEIPHPPSPIPHPPVAHFRLERLMRAVFAPGLRQSLKLAVGWLT